MINMQLASHTLLQGGKYRIIRVLGQGGFGITYEAEQVNLGRRVALKEFFMKDYCNRDSETFQVSVPSVGSLELVTRFKEKFLKEARLIASLNHPNIVKIHDVFEENGTAYYVMEFLSGGSLADKCVGGRSLPESDALGYVRQIASALKYLHSLPTPLNHLDIKPSNVMLSDTDLAVLIDFGISKRYDVTGGQTSSTPVGISHGYSPLEQYREGGVSVFSPMTDIYSLGATLYKLVTGTIPPQASDILVDGLPDLPETLSPSIGKAIEAAMQPRPKDRPKSVSAFLSILDEDPSSIAPKKDIPRPNKQDVRKDETAIHKAGEEDGFILCENGHEWVDLGLPSGLKWASCNLGALSPEEYGDFYAWGETETKKDFRWRTYAHQNRIGFLGDAKSFSKYSAIVDGLTELQPEDDVATVKLGKGCRIPTIEEWDELLEYCTWEWNNLNGHYGIRLISDMNGQSIFFPAAGYRDAIFHHYEGSIGDYWSSSLDKEFSDNAWNLSFNPGGFDYHRGIRSEGLSIRPVAE